MPPTAAPAAPRADSAVPTLRELLATWREANADWVASDRQLPKPGWWSAVEAIIDTAAQFQTIVQPHYSQGLIHLIDAYLEFLPKVQTGLIPERPTTDIMRALGELELAERTGPAAKRKTEPIEELRKLDPPIQPDQVAKMYGITIGQGAMLLAGTWSLPAGHVTPEESQRATQATLQAKALREAFVRWGERADAVVSGDDWVPPLESIEELLSLPGMTVEQVATMHRIPVEQVQAIIAGKFYASPAASAPTGKGPEELSAEELEAEVLTIHKEHGDLKAGEIAEMVGNGMTAQRVGKIIASAVRGE